MYFCASSTVSRRKGIGPGSAMKSWIRCEACGSLLLLTLSPASMIWGLDLCEEVVSLQYVIVSLETRQDWMEVAHTWSHWPALTKCLCVEAWRVGRIMWGRDGSGQGQRYRDALDAVDRSCTLRKNMIFEIASKRGRQTSLNSFEFQEGARFNLAIRLYHLREQVRLCQKKKLHKVFTLCRLRTSEAPKTVSRSACAQGHAHPHHQRHFDWLHLRLLIILVHDARDFLQG
jgi:hypothetical protein